MTKSRAALTELEGAILGVLRRGPGMTPYAVRKVFLASRSEEWSGSAGAVYPAIARLAAAGLIAARAGADRRGTKAYALSAAGRRAHDAWLCDAGRAAGIGIDPFRTRASLWQFLPARRRNALFRALTRTIRVQRSAIAAAAGTQDEADAAVDRLVLTLLDARLAWLTTAP
jgi:DNA-binding PadR family transcriptional regulator